jgi:hypothetical protein
MSQTNQIQRMTFPELGPVFNQHYSTLIDGLNSVLGYRGDVQMKGNLDLTGNRISNVAEPVNSNDVVTHAFAQNAYSASALRPQLEATGATPLQSVRRLNDQVQREQYSSFLNDTFSAPPSANNTIVQFSGASGSTTITIPAGHFTYADNSSMPFTSRTDTVTNPSTVNISSITSVGQVVTVETSSSLALSVGQTVGIAGVTPPTYDGSYTVATVIDSHHFTYILNIGTGAGTGGTVTTVGVYYYYVQKGSNNLHVLSQVQTTDTPFTRLPSSLDGKQLIAIAVVNSDGGVDALSAAGGTAQSQINAGSFF